MRISDWSSDLCSADLAMQQLGAIRASRGTPCNLLARGRTPLPGRSENRLTGGEKRMSVPSHMLGGLSLLALDAAAAPAQAQDAPSGSYDGNEIIVKATKRDASLQDVPFSLNAHNEQTIERANAIKNEELSHNVAGLHAQTLRHAQSKHSI